MKNILPVCATLAMVLGVLLAVRRRTVRPGGAPAPAADKFDVAVNFTYKVAKIASTTNRFVLPGGSLDAAYNFGGKAKGLGLVVDINGESKSNIEPGVSLTQFSVMGGARYTFHLAPKNPHAVDLYGQFLGGGVFASNSLFPGLVRHHDAAPTAVRFSRVAASTSASRAASRCVFLKPTSSATHLPNSTNQRQYDVRFSNGVVFRF